MQQYNDECLKCHCNFNYTAYCKKNIKICNYCKFFTYVSDKSDSFRAMVFKAQTIQRQAKTLYGVTELPNIEEKYKSE